MLNAGRDGGGICERPLGLRSVGFVGEVGAGVVEVCIIDTGRDLVMEERLEAVSGTVVLVLLVLECVCACGARMLEERARPLGLACPCGSLVDAVRFSPGSGGRLRGTALVAGL